jgi:hypothetical protein
MPLIPVWAFALPELTIKILQKPLLFFLSQIRGAEGVDVFEYAAATGTELSKTTINKSSRFFLKPV